MSTDKSLKYLKPKDKFLIANISNYFDKHSRWDISSYSGNWGQQKKRFPSTTITMRNWYTFAAAAFETGTIQTCGRL